jgi:hypothetical protein
MTNVKKAEPMKFDNNYQTIKDFKLHGPPITLEENCVFPTSLCDKILVTRNILQLKSL